MQISASALTGATVLEVTPDDNGPYDLPRSLVLAINGAADAATAAVQHLYDTGQVAPGDGSVIDQHWPQQP